MRACISSRHLIAIKKATAMNFTVSIAWFFTVGLLCACLSACNNKARLKPRSQIVEEAQDKGINLPAPDAERSAFFQPEEISRQRILKLIESRAASGGKDANYRVGPDDELEINVFDVPELNVTAKVQQSGFISLPLLGGLKVSQMTEAEIHNEITNKLTKFVKSPQVNVFISGYGSQKVAVIGAVQKPGTFSLKKGQTSVLELIGEAGGVGAKAGNFVQIIPAELSGLGAANDVEARARLSLANSNTKDPTVVGIEVYLDQVLGAARGLPLEIPVRGGDVIVVLEAGKVMVEGEVEKPGSYELGQQMTLLGALAASGGITYAAKIDEVEIVRELNMDQKSHLVLDLEKLASGEERDVRLRNGDILRVPSHSGRRLTQDTFDGITKIINFGIGGSVNLVP